MSAGDGADPDALGEARRLVDRARGLRTGRPPRGDRDSTSSGAVDVDGPRSESSAATPAAVVAAPAAPARRVRAAGVGRAERPGRRATPAG